MSQLSPAAMDGAGPKRQEMDGHNAIYFRSQVKEKEIKRQKREKKSDDRENGINTR